jgi:TPR repeat protein
MTRLTLNWILVFVLLVTSGFAEPDSVAELREKAERGDANAQFELGIMYYSGEGVPKDLVQAQVWWNIAGANGQEVAKKNLAIIEKEMTSEQKAEAMKMARELFAKLPKGK